MESIDVTGIPEPADKIITKFVAAIKRIPGDFAEGIYLTGSIPLNDFHPNKSDIDFLVLCKESPTKELLGQLVEVHRHIRDEFGRIDLSGGYLTRESLRTKPSQSIPVLHFHEGKLSTGTFGMAPITLFELKTIAYTVWGKPARTLPVTIHPKELNDFLYENINSYWSKWINSHSSFVDRKGLLVLIPRLTEWAVLGVARQLYTLQTGKIVSKTQAGYYCLEQIPSRYHRVIQEAIRIRKDNHMSIYPTFKGSYYVAPSIKRCHQTIDCVNYIIDLFNQVYLEKQHNLR